LLDGTPILDIKPYLPYADSITSAKAGYAVDAPPLLPVQWSAQALADIDALPASADMRLLINEVLAQDPRPAYRAQHEDNHEYGVWLANINVRFSVSHQVVQVVAVTERKA
jgi:hypothetical protein